MMRIALLDDHKIVRDGLKAMLQPFNDILIVGEAADAETMLSKIKGFEANILILDLILPGMDGSTFAEKLRVRMPEIKILVLSSNTDELSVIRAVQAGVKGYVSKDASSDELLKALRTIDAGDEYYGETISAIIFKSYISKASDNQKPLKKIIHEVLTEREKEVIACFGDGLSYKETAAKLCLSPRTVETHRNAVMEKLGLHSLAELIKYAIIHGIVKL